MEIKAELLYPYTQDEKESFIINQNHRLGYEIREVERTVEYEEKVLEFEEVEEEQPIYNDEGEIIGYETVIVKKPIMVIDEETGEEYQKFHYETREMIVIDLQALGYTEEEKQQQERERLDNLELTGADVERAIYEAKDMDFEDLVQFVIDSELVGLDVKRLKIELKANHFVRKHPYINIIGSMLGYSPDDMDYLFLNKSFPIKEENEQEIIENI